MGDCCGAPRRFPDTLTGSFCPVAARKTQKIRLFVFGDVEDFSQPVDDLRRGAAFF
jgi:hypothetical protein